MVRGLYFANHGQILPPSCPTQAKLLTCEGGEWWAGRLAQLPELWVSERGGCEWMMYTSPADPHSVYCLMWINGVYFEGASGKLVDDDDESAGPSPPLDELIRTP